jgi:lysophospholipase L1-like esterase
MKNQPNRRNFLKELSLTALGATIIPDLVSAHNPVKKGPSFDTDAPVVLFQGDSITDAGRSRDQYYANQARGMGTGYVMQIVGELLGGYPTKNYQCYNRGISGHKVFQLAERWDIDALSLKPDILSILIGVNDYWHTLNGSYDGTVEVYEKDLRQLLDRTKEALPNVKLIIGEPFAVAGGRAIDEKWENFHPYRGVARQIASDYDAVFLPYHSVFEEALKSAPVDYWCPDGVHPSIAGANLMAATWMEGFKKL